LVAKHNNLQGSSTTNPAGTIYKSRDRSAFDS